MSGCWDGWATRHSTSWSSAITTASTRALDAVRFERLAMLNPTGRHYLLRGVRLGAGRFHPKSYLAVTLRSARLIVGSGNLSTDGIDQGREVFTVYRSGTAGGDAAITAWRAWAARLVNAIDDTALLSRFADLESRLPKPPVLAPVIESPLLHNLDRPLIDELCERVGPEPVDELIVTAPFYDKGAEALGRLISRLRPSVVRVFFTTSTSVEGPRLAERLQACGASVETFAYQPDRFTHAKLIGVTRGGQGWLLSGSANLSHAALTLTSKTGNVELAVIAPLHPELVRATFVPPEAGVEPQDLAILNQLTYEEPAEETITPWPVRLLRVEVRPDGRINVCTDPVPRPGWSLMDHQRSEALQPTDGAWAISAGGLLGPLVNVADDSGGIISGPAVIDDPVALERALQASESAAQDHKPPELFDADLDSPLGQALLTLHQTMMMDVTDVPRPASGGLGTEEAGAEGKDSLWERLERETLQRDPRARRYNDLVARGGGGSGMSEPILELLEKMRNRLPIEPAERGPFSVIRLIHEAQTIKGPYNWTVTARVRVRARNVLRRWAAAQSDPRLAWVNPAAPLMNLIMVASVFANLWQAQSQPGAPIELEDQDLDDLWARWFQPFVGSGRGDGWLDRTDLDPSEVRRLLDDSFCENATALCWLAVRPGKDKRQRVIRWQPALRAAFERDLLHDSSKNVAEYLSGVMSHGITARALGDDIQWALDFIDDDLWCEQTAAQLDFDDVRIDSLSPEQDIQVVIQVEGVLDGINDNRVPQLIAAIRRYRSVDAVAVYSVDAGWRLGITTDQPAWYLPPGATTEVNSRPVEARTIDALASSGGVLATLFGGLSQVA